jgi:hypothetical protein
MKTVLPVLLTVLLFLSACGQSGNKESSGEKAGTGNQAEISNNTAGRVKPEKSGKVVAKVNGVPIYQDELNGRPVESLVTDEILYQEGLSEGLEKKYQEKIMQYQMSLVLREVKDKIMSGMPPEKEVTEQELLDYYNSAKDINYTNLRVEEINFTDKELGDQILKMAQEGKDFNDIVKALPGAGSEVKVNELGYDRKLNAFFEVKEVGAISNIVNKKDGTYSVLKIEELHVIPFDSAKNTIKFIVESLKKAAAYNQYAQKIAKDKNYNVEIVKQ